MPPSCGFCLIPQVNLFTGFAPFNLRLEVFLLVMSCNEATEGPLNMFGTTLGTFGRFISIINTAVKFKLMAAIYTFVFVDRHSYLLNYLLKTKPPAPS